MHHPSLSIHQQECIDQILARYKWKQQEPVSLLLNSAQNENFRVKTDHGEYFVRLHALRLKPENVLREHRVLFWAARQDLPVILPIADPDGTLIHSIDGQLISIFPWMEGRNLVPESMKPWEAKMIGEMQGKLHHRLVSYEDSELPNNETGSSWSTEGTFEVLEKICSKMSEENLPVSAVESFQNAIQIQKEMLSSKMACSYHEFESLNRQPVHGDYHDGNVLLSSQNDILAVVDWELVGRLPRVFELLRAVSFVTLLNPILVDRYLAGYQEWIELTREECQMGVEMWFQSLLHDTWVLERRFLYGIIRAERYFPYAHQRLLQFADSAFRKKLSQQLFEKVRS